jgi:hypothetical protein
MKEILIIPDIHGRTFWKPALNYNGEIIFLGDYIDPYPEEGITTADAYCSLNEIVEFKKQNPDRVTLLIGNHELQYYDEKFQCSRFSERYYERYHKILTDEATAGLFQVCKQIDNYLFIHAGITKNWYGLHLAELQSMGSSLEEQVNRLFIQNPESFFEISYYRGGFNQSGSPLWADARELFSEFKHFDNKITQIIGHTQISSDEPIMRDNIWLLDNRELYILKNNELDNYSV